MQDLLAPSKTAKGKNGFQILMDALPDTHKARWFAGAALNSAEQAMASVMSTVLSRLNAFLDSELEQVLCFDSAIDAELFAARKSAIFLVLPEEDPSKNFMAGLMIQTLSRELFSVADENGGKLPNRVVLFCDELGTMPAFDILPLFSAGRSRNTNKITDYGDAYGHWAYEALAWAVDNGVLVGTSEDRLNPDGYLTRAQMAAMIDRLFGAYKSADISRFTDVPVGAGTMTTSPRRFTWGPSPGTPIAAWGRMRISPANMPWWCWPGRSACPLPVTPPLPGSRTGTR